jgi:hypothetical protein
MENTYSKYVAIQNEVNFLTSVTGRVNHRQLLTSEVRYNETENGIARDFNFSYLRFSVFIGAHWGGGGEGGRHPLGCDIVKSH